MNNIAKKIFSIIILLSLLTVIYTLPVNAYVSSWQNSESILPFTTTDFASDNFKQSLQNIVKVHANYVTLIIPYYQSNIYSSDLAPGWNTPTDQSLISGINYAHSLGLKVAIKIHPESYDGQWRAYINPTNRATWFTTYGNILNHYADIAKTNGVEEYFLGTEMSAVTMDNTNPTNTSHWRTLISQVRSRYQGIVTYDSQYDNPPEATNIKFWNDLDYIAISAYFLLGNNVPNPTVSDLKNSWDYWNTNNIKPLSQQWNKKIMFGELGYRSIDNAHLFPWDSQRAGNYNGTEQANDYQAFFEYWNSQPDFMGVHWWYWSVDPNFGGPGNTDYTPHNKPAETILTTWLGGNQTTLPPTQGSSPASSYTIKTTYQSSTITANITANSPATNNLIDLEIYQGNTQVFQKYWLNQNFASGQTLSFPTSWTPSSNANYTVKIGIFSNDWVSNYYWLDNALVINSVSSSPTPTSITPTPILTTPTPTPILIIPTGTPTMTPTPNPTIPMPTPTAAPTPFPTSQIQLWWPTNNSHISGTQPFKGVAGNLGLANYQMFWQVDGGQQNLMSDNFTDAPHKEADVNIDSWNWKGAGPYVLTFTAKDNQSTTLSQTSISIWH